MRTYWLKGHLKTPEEKEERIKTVLSYRNAFDDLRQVIDNEFRKRESVRDYGPGWEYKQVAANEYNAALDDILKTIDLNRKD